MWNWKRIIILTIYFSCISVIIAINSTLIVEWLNKSLFVDYNIDIDLKNVHDSFSNGTSVIFLITIIIYALIGTFLVSLLVTNLLFSGLIFANQTKIIERNEFITFKELQTISSPKELLSFIDVPMITALLISFTIILFLITLHYITKFASEKIGIQTGIRMRVVIFLIAFLPFIIIFQNPNTFNKASLKFEEEDGHNFNPVKRARSKGFIPSFFHTIDPDYMNKPIKYTKKNMKIINDKYTNISKKINENRNQALENSQTIYYLSETLMDPMSIPDLLKNETPIPFISNTIDNHIGGSMYSQYIGGGTANIEWSLLSSFSLEILSDPVSVTPYSDFYLQSKNHSTVLSFFDDKKIALHPYSAHLYKRRSVYETIGFDDFLFLNNGIEHTDKLGTHKRVSDAAFHKDLLRISNNDDVGFIHALTMQNHSPYNDEIPDMEYKPDINLSVFPEKNETGLVNYLQGLRASDEAVEELIDEIESSDKDINILFFGDHFPSLFRGLEEKFPDNQLNETPWFIYMNHGRSKDGIKLDGISPIFLTTILLKEGNYYVTPFQGLMDEMLTYGIKRIGNNYVITEEGKITDQNLDDIPLELVEDYRSIVYDALFGSNWLPDSFFTM